MELKDIHQRIRESKLEKKKINDVYKDVLAQTKPYQDVLAELNALKAKKLQMETEIRGQFVSEMEKMDKLSQDIKNDQEMMSDLALTKLMKGETVELTDENDTKYEPVIKVTFKKQG